MIVVFSLRVCWSFSIQGHSLNEEPTMDPLMGGPVWERMTPAKSSQNWASTALGFPFIQRCPLWTKTWKDTENRKRGWEFGGKGRRFPAETCYTILDRKVWCMHHYVPINIKSYVSTIHSASFLPPLSVPKKIVIHPRPCLCQGAVTILIPPMDQTSDLKRRPQDKPLSLECSRWGFWRQILGK